MLLSLRDFGRRVRARNVTHFRALKSTLFAHRYQEGGNRGEIFSTIVVIAPTGFTVLLNGVRFDLIVPDTIMDLDNRS